MAIEPNPVARQSASEERSVLPDEKNPLRLPVVAMVGAGQLSRMTHQAAIALGQSLRVLAGSHDESAAVVAADTRIGDYTDLATVRAFAAGAQALTFDHEHVPGDLLRELVAEGVPVYPPPQALVFAQDKLAMRQKLTELRVPMPQWADVASMAELSAYGDAIGWPLILKTPTGGYDGKGVWRLDSSARAAALVPELLKTHPALLVERCVPLQRELAVQVARSPFGQVAVWPVVETVQVDGVCTEVIAPAPGLTAAAASYIQQLAITIATELNVVGVLAVELFDLGTPGTSGMSGNAGNDDSVPVRVAINELAMRPHNSGHWTIEGSRTSQFEQHLRAVLDYPLGDTRLTAPTVVMANVLAAAEHGEVNVDERLHHVWAADPAVKVHLYGKSLRPGRKVGHVTVLAQAGDTDAALPQLRERAYNAAQLLAGTASLPQHAA